MTPYTKFGNSLSIQDAGYTRYNDKSKSEMENLCNKNLSCLGYYAGGQQALLWELGGAGNWAKANDRADLYVKNPSNLDKYTFQQNKDIGGEQNNISRLENTSINDVAAACNANNECKAFNTHGWLKRKS